MAYFMLEHLCKHLFAILVYLHVGWKSNMFNDPSFSALLADAPPSVLENVVAQFAKILPSDAKARKQFVTSGGLKKVNLQRFIYLYCFSL